MLNNKYTMWDMVKFYYNVKIQYKPNNRSYQMPIVFISCTIIGLAIMNTLLKPKEMFYYYIEGGIFLLLFILYFSLIYPPTKSRSRQYS